MSNDQNSTRWKDALTKAKPRFETIAKQTRVRWEQESIFAQQAIMKNDYLQKCDPVTIRDSIINVATVGLTLNPAHKLAYLVPRDGICCLDISYLGMLRIATDSGSVRHAAVELVYSHDDFKWHGKHALPHHEFDPFASDDERGEFRGAYITAKLSDGDWLCDHISAAQIYQIRECSKAYKDKSGTVRKNSIWVVWFEEMVKKTLIKRASKIWPKSERLREAADILNRHEGLEDAFQNARNVTPQRPALADQTLNDHQQNLVQAAIEETGADKSRLLADLSVESIDQIPAARFSLVMGRIHNEMVDA